MNRFCRRTLLFLLLFQFLCKASGQTYSWPVEPVDKEHPIGNTLGEFQQSLSQTPPGIYQHEGIDILATPNLTSSGTVDVSAPWVVVTVSGKVGWLNEAANVLYNSTYVKDANGVRYNYYHLAYQSFDANYVYAFNNNSTITVAPGDPIAKIVRWGCDYHHLHYDVREYDLIQGVQVAYRDPITAITPHYDPDFPEIRSINLAQDNLNPNSNPWILFSPIGSMACTIVSGKVDIIAEVSDRQAAGSALPGAAHVDVRKLRWRACPESNPQCNWIDTHDFSDMPSAWDAVNNIFSEAQFSTASPWISTGSECSAKQTFSIPTNWIQTQSQAGNLVTVPSNSGSWNTGNGTYPDGSYAVSVEATDFSGNIAIRSVHACVHNTAGCTTELTIRDAPDDTGAIPYAGHPFWFSPDIIVNRGTPDENQNINVGAANTVEVNVWNAGSCTLPVKTTYRICLGWSRPSGSIPYPLPLGQNLGCKTEIVPLGGWTPGTSRTTIFTWAPPTGSLALGTHSLVAWSDMAADPVKNTTSVVLDDNRAQRKINFKAVSAPGLPPPLNLRVR